MTSNHLMIDELHECLSQSYNILGHIEFRAFDSVNSFLSLPLKEIKQYYALNQQKFEHNLQTLKNLQKLETEQIKADIKLQNLNFLK